MADENKDSKTEEPTDKRLEKAREDGDVAQSQEIKSLAVLLGGFVALALLAPWISDHLRILMLPYLSQTHAISLDLQGLRGWVTGLMIDIGILLAPVFGLLVLASLAGNYLQVGLLFTPKKMQPKLQSIDPLAGAKRMVSKKKLMELPKSIFKLIIVGGISILVSYLTLDHPEKVMGQDFWITLKDMYWVLVVMVFTILVAFAFIAILDWVWERHTHREKLKMTKQEVKDEYKQSEGDPQIKARIRALRQERYRDRMMQSVPESTVVITNPTHFAVALKYDMETMPAPKLVAKGADHSAKRIRDVAEENEVPIVENPPLARALYASVELDQEVPPDHYKAVAEVIGYVMRLKGVPKGQRPPPPPVWEEGGGD